MSDRDVRILDVLVATYDGIAAAETDLMAVRDLYQLLGASHRFDAAVVSRNERGEPKIHRTYEAGMRHEGRKGLGLAAGSIAAAFPTAGIAAVHTGISREDLQKIAERLNTSQAALVVVYDSALADQVTQQIRAAGSKLIGKIRDLRTDMVAGG